MNAWMDLWDEQSKPNASFLPFVTKEIIGCVSKEIVTMFAVKIQYIASNSMVLPKCYSNWILAFDYPIGPTTLRTINNHEIKAKIEYNEFGELAITSGWIEVVKHLALKDSAFVVYVFDVFKANVLSPYMLDANNPSQFFCTFSEENTHTPLKFAGAARAVGAGALLVNAWNALEQHSLLVHGRFS